MSVFKRLRGRVLAFFNNGRSTLTWRLSWPPILKWQSKKTLSEAFLRPRRDVWHWFASVEWNKRKNNIGRLVGL